MATWTWWWAAATAPSGTSRTPARVRCPTYVERSGAANPFDGVDVGEQSAPVFADLDGDGDPELVLGDNGGALVFYENTSTGAGGDDVIEVGDGVNIVVGGFGNDTITTGASADIILGDNGAVIYTPGTAQRAAGAVDRRARRRGRRRPDRRPATATTWCSPASARTP